MAKDECEREISQRRLDHFIHQCGAIDLKVAYLEPVQVQESGSGAPPPLEPAPMHLLLYPADPQLKQVDATRTRAMVAAILFVHYRLDQNDPIARAALNSINDLEV